MNFKPLHLRLIALATGASLALALVISLIVALLPLWMALPLSASVKVGIWAMVMMALAVVFCGATLAMRTLVLVVVAAFLRGRHAFRLLPTVSSQDMAKPRAYREWAFEHNGKAQMGMFIGRFQVVLFGVPVPYPTVA